MTRQGPGAEVEDDDVRGGFAGLFAIVAAWLVSVPLALAICRSEVVTTWFPRLHLALLAGSLAMLVLYGNGGISAKAYASAQALVARSGWSYVRLLSTGLAGGLLAQAIFVAGSLLIWWIGWSWVHVTWSWLLAYLVWPAVAVAWIRTAMLRSAARTE